MPVLLSNFFFLKPDSRKLSNKCFSSPFRRRQLQLGPPKQHVQASRIVSFMRTLSLAEFFDKAVGMNFNSDIFTLFR